MQELEKTKQPTEEEVLKLIDNIKDKSQQEKLDEYYTLYSEHIASILDKLAEGTKKFGKWSEWNMFMCGIIEAKIKQSTTLAQRDQAYRIVEEAIGRLYLSTQDDLKEMISFMKELAHSSSLPTHLVSLAKELGLLQSHNMNNDIMNNDIMRQMFEEGY